MRDNFSLFIREISSKLSELVDKDSSFLIISKKNVDGIVSSCLLCKYLLSSNVQFHLTFTSQSDLESFPEDSIVIFEANCSLNFLKKTNKNVFIIKHDPPVIKEKKIGNCFYINPELFGINGLEMSCTIIVGDLLENLRYDLYEKKYLILTGLLENNEEIKIPDKFKESVQIKEDLDLFSPFSKPLFKALELSDRYIPGLTLNEKRILQFLKELRIPFRKNKDFITLDKLSEDEKKKIIGEIVRLRKEKGIINAEKVTKKYYLLTDKNFSDLHEVKDVIKSLIYFDKIHLFFKFCVFEKNESISDYLIKYKKKVITFVKEIIEGAIKIREEKQCILIPVSDYKLCEDIAEIILKNKTFAGNRIVMCFAEFEDEIFICMRHTLKNKQKELHNTIRQTLTKVKGKENPYTAWCGAVVEKNKFDDFLKNFKIIARQNNLLLF